MTTAIGSYATASLLKTRAGITDSNDDTLIGTICDQVNQYIESVTKRVLAPITSAVYTYDGDGGTELYLPLPSVGPPIGGIRAITQVEYATYSGGSYTVLAAGNYHLRGSVGMTGPYERLCMSDRHTAGPGYWPYGYATVKVTGTAGWGAIPDDITEVALVAATRAWHSREAGQVDIVGTDELGRPVVSRFFSQRDFATLMDYAITDVLIS